MKIYFALISLWLLLEIIISLISFSEADWKGRRKTLFAAKIFILVDTIFLLLSIKFLLK